MKRLSCAAAAVCLLVGCGNRLENSYTVAIDPSLSASQVADIDAAIRDWESNVNVSFKVISWSCDSTEADDLVCIRASNNAGVLAECDSSHEYGCTIRSEISDSSRIILDLDKATGDSILRITVGHELGHAMGLAHTGAGSLMAPNSAIAASHVTCTDVEQFQDLRGISGACKAEPPSTGP